MRAILLSTALAAVMCGCSGAARPAPRPAPRDPRPGAVTPTFPASVPPSVTAAPSSAVPTPSPGSTLPVGRWPDACRLLTDADLRSLVPDETGVSRAGSRPEPVGGDQPAVDTSCAYALERPATPSGFPQDEITVDIRSIGDPMVLSTTFRGDEQMARQAGEFEDYGTSLGATSSFWDGEEIENLAGDVVFFVSGRSATDAGRWRAQVLTRAVTVLVAKFR